jgi:superfamily II DNA or RNA helicase
VHHLSVDGTWAQKIEQFPCSTSVALSGTPMRSDNQTLFGVPFQVGTDGDQYYVALHEVTMRDAHEEGRILKRVQAHIVDYRLKMVHTDTGETVEMSLSQMAEMARSKSDVDAFLARKRLRFHDVYLQSLLTPAFATFRRKRTEKTIESIGRTATSSRNHQMLVIAMSNLHAAAILEFVKRNFPEFRSARIGQDVASQERERLLAEYRNGAIDVMVQVDMIGEGTDIKPISVIVKADLVRALSKTLQQVFRGMRYFDGFSEQANVCDIFAANDSEVVATLEWITSEEQIGVRLRQARETEQAAIRSAPVDSPWQLRGVEHRTTQTHALELFPELVRDVPQIPPPVAAAPDAVDVSAREQALRQECASLAATLAHVLRSAGRPTEIASIHAEAKRLFSKAQEDLSLKELSRKRSWLERCITARRMLAG